MQTEASNPLRSRTSASVTGSSVAEHPNQGTDLPIWSRNNANRLYEFLQCRPHSLTTCSSSMATNTRWSRNACSYKTFVWNVSDNAISGLNSTGFVSLVLHCTDTVGNVDWVPYRACIRRFGSCQATRLCSTGRSIYKAWNRVSEQWTWPGRHLFIDFFIILSDLLGSLRAGSTA